jgi:hypothetical protein
MRSMIFLDPVSRRDGEALLHERRGGLGGEGLAGAQGAEGVDNTPPLAAPCVRP